MEKKFSIILATFLIFASILLFIFLGSKNGIEHSIVSKITGNAISETPLGTAIEINKNNSLLRFEGYAPGKFEDGVFNDFSITLYIINGKINGFSGEIFTSSVRTGKKILNAHLRSQDFFDSRRYPKILFMSKSISKEEITGDLTLHGITKTISFPAKIDKNKITADFLLDTTPFNIKYPGVNKNIRIYFIFSR